MTGLTIAQALHQRTERWHIAAALSLHAGISALVFHDKSTPADEASLRSVCEDLFLYRAVRGDGARVHFGEVEDARRLNRRLRRAPTHRGVRSLSTVRLVDGRAIRDAVYVTQATHAIASAIASARSPESVCARFVENVTGALPLRSSLSALVEAVGAPRVLIHRHLTRAERTDRLTKRLAEIVAALGYRWCVVSEDPYDAPPGDGELCDFASRLRSLGCTARLEDGTDIDDLRYRPVLFDQLRSHGHVAIGAASPTFDAYSALIGMPAMCITTGDPREIGAERVAKLRPIYHHVHDMTAPNEHEADQALAGAVESYLGAFGQAARRVRSPKDCPLGMAPTE